MTFAKVMSDKDHKFVRLETSPDFKNRVERIAQFIEEKMVATGERTDVCLTAMMHIVAKHAVDSGMPKEEWMLACQMVYDGFRSEMN